MAEEFQKARDTELILYPGVFAYVLDETKGKVNTLCGPIKTSLSNTDRLVTYISDTRRFVPAPQSQAIQTNITASKGQYVILENPSKDSKQPEAGKLEDMSLSALKMGQMENLPGPVSFALWPGQNATIVQGHHLRSNQYLLVRVYDDEATQANWDKSVVKTAIVPVTDTEGKEEKKSKEATAEEVDRKTGLNIKKEDLRTGQLLIIRGTNVAFYIPPTGIEVLKDENSKYVRDAVTLERLEYSILLDEDGNKSYVKGPAVVFPEPTQNFVTSGEKGKRKFRAFELQPSTGLHLKVIADYTENGRTYYTGEELFITGEDQAIYYPCPEHAIISYNGGDKHFATAIPAGEGRYVMDRKHGNIDLVKGPDMFLANPIEQVMVRRILTEKECALYYPGNAEVLEVNKALWEEARAPRTKSGIPILPTSEGLSLGQPDLAGISYSTAVNSMVPQDAGLRVSASVSPAAPKAGDSIQRSSQYKPPRTITLDSKYQGAVRVEVYSGYAVQVVDSTGTRRIVVGPQTLLLEYDEKLVPLTLSTGRPKTPSTRKDTVYLKHLSNPVSDLLSLKTQDMVDVDVQVKYLVRFEDQEKDKWFAIDNYIQYMVDHLRSVIANAVRRMSVQSFYQNSADVLRDIVLGAKTEKERSLKHFQENGMTVYDLEVISFVVRDAKIADLLVNSRKEALSDSIALERQVQKLEVTKTSEDAKRKTMQEISQTLVLTDRMEQEKLARLTEINMSKAEADLEMARAKAEVEDIILEQNRKEQEQDDQAAEADLNRRIRAMVEEANSSKIKMEAIQPQLVEALVSAAQSGILERVAPTMGALAFINGSDLETTLNTMVKGTSAEGILNNLKNVSARKGLTTSGARKLGGSNTTNEE